MHISQACALFDNHCVQMFPERTSLTDDMVESWCAQRATESSNTCRVRSYAIANFVNYLRERGADVSVPAIPAKRRSTYMPHAFTDSELERFFRASDNMPMGKPNSLASRTRRIVAPVFFRLLYSSGIRTYETRMLSVEDVDLAQGVLCIRKSKGPNQHYVALHDTMTDLLRKYDHAIRVIYPKRVYFFPSSRGSFISKEWVAQTFRLIWSRANTSHAIAYEFRHNYAVENRRSQKKDLLNSVSLFLVGATGFEPAASWSRTKRATKLRYAPLSHICYFTMKLKCMQYCF